MPAAIAIPLIIGAASAATTVYAANKSAGAAKNAAKLGTEAANHAADVEAQSARDALQFQTAQSTNAFENNEAARRGNYQAWVARERRLASIGEHLGWGGRDIPAYVPGVAPRFGGPAMGSVGSYLDPHATLSTNSGNPYALNAGPVGPLRPMNRTPALTVPDPYRVGSVGSYLS